MARLSRSTPAGRRQASRAADAALKQPVNSVAPAITGTAQQGQTLTVSNGTWSKSPDSYSRQWLRNGSPIAGATGTTYLLALADVGATIRCTVKAAKGGVANVTTSAATASVIAA